MHGMKQFANKSGSLAAKMGRGGDLIGYKKGSFAAKNGERERLRLKKQRHMKQKWDPSF